MASENNAGQKRQAPPTPHQVFTPGAPIQGSDFFSGRIDQLNRTIETLQQPGRHPLIFGKRGVGKTSLANVVTLLSAGVPSTKITCNSSDTFDTIWRKALSQLVLEYEYETGLFNKQKQQGHINLSELLPHDRDLEPQDILDCLKHLDGTHLIVLDEFDRVSDDTRSRHADLIKTLSDNSPDTKILIVGVGDSVISLIRDHQSIERNLRQIHIPPMNNEEIGNIFLKGFETLGIDSDSASIKALTDLTDGFPHYAHLLGLSVSKICYRTKPPSRVDKTAIRLACSLAVNDAIESLQDAYLTAIRTTKKSNYQQILIACAYARTDEAGVFRATDVVEVGNEMFSLDLSVQSVVPALGAFSSPDRGNVLTSVDVSGRKQYKFTDPMMRSYLKMKHHSDPIGVV